MLKVAFGGIGVVALALLAGCAGTQSGSSAAPEVQYTYQDPETVPREQWSQAMVIAREGLGLYGLKDVVAPQGFSVTAQGQANFNGADGLATGALGAASPSTHLSSGASLALGAGLFLLGGGASPPPMFSQLAFWVPADMASDAEEASRIAAQTYHEMRTKAFNPPRNNDLRETSMYPKAHRDAFLTVQDQLKRRQAPFVGEAEHEELMGASGKHYGPIFIPLFDQDVYTDFRRSKVGADEFMSRIMAHMPSWSVAYLHIPNDMPPTILYNQNIHQFIVEQK